MQCICILFHNFIKNQQMPINKRAFIRYNALDECFRDKAINYDIEHLLKKCNCAIRAH